MPGYRELAQSFSGSVADRVREAAAMEKEGELLGALRAYEEAMDDYLNYQSEMPALLCGRLASLYRRLGLNDEEVALLERYRDSQTCDDARSRFQARLSKAQIIAEKKRRQDSGALASIRAVRAAGSGRARRASRLQAAAEEAAAGPTTHDAGRVLLAELAQPHADIDSPGLVAAITSFCATVKTGEGVEQLVGALKATVHAGNRPAHLSPSEWKTRGSLALQLCVAAYFGDESGA
jgi:hypothetical protein